MKYKIAFVTGLPNWHFPELYRKLAQHPRIDLTMLFCETWNERFLKQAFGIEKENFGIDLLEGYKYKFLKNYSLIKPHFNKTRLLSHLNVGIWKEIRGGNYHAVVITMWNDVVYWLAALTCRISNIPFFFAGDSTILTEQAKPAWKRKIKKFLLGKMLFPLASGFLYHTRLNYEFYRYYNVHEEKLFFFPLSIDYSGLSQIAREVRKKKQVLRAKYGIRPEAVVFLFVGRLVKEKRPFYLLKAYVELKQTERALTLAFVGDGYLKNDLQHFVSKKGLADVHFFGFRPKTEIPNFYALSDILVLPSDYEPHGDVVKEAMCFGLPVIISDKVGAAYDVVEHGVNGLVYPCGDVEALIRCINELLDEGKRYCMGERALEKIKNWDHEVAISGLINALDSIYGRSLNK